MLTTILLIQEKWATKKVLAVFTLLYFSFPFYLLPKILPTGRPLDLFLYYTPSEAYSLIASYGADNRASYIWGSATIDVLYPLCYATFLGLLLTFLMVKSYDKHSKIQRLRLLPYSILVADILENITIITMLKEYPIQHRFIAILASFFTTTKWILFLLVLLLLLYFLLRFYQQSQSSKII